MTPEKSSSLSGTTRRSGTSGKNRNPRKHPPTPPLTTPSPASETTETAPRERILAAAIDAFAVNGYNGATTRTIAHAAGVNIAMINYYFGSKQGLLEAAIETYFNRVAAIVQDIFSEPGDPEHQIRRLVTAVITFFRHNSNLLAVMLNTWSIHIPEITEKKARSLNQIVTFIQSTILPRIPGLNRIEKPALIVGPALVGSMALHFMFRPIIETVRGQPCDESFYDSMIDITSTILVSGLTGGFVPPVPNAKGDSR